MPSWEPWFRDIVVVLVSVAASVGVNWTLGPVLHVREERARRNFNARREVIRAVKNLISRLSGERIDRLQQRFDVPPFSEAMLNQDEIEQLLWHVLHGLEDPDLDRSVAKRVRERLDGIAGPWRMEYLLTCPRPDAVAEKRRGYMAFVHGQMNPQHESSLITRMLHDPRGEAIVGEAIKRFEEILRLLED